MQKIIFWFYQLHLELSIEVFLFYHSIDFIDCQTKVCRLKAGIFESLEQLMKINSLVPIVSCKKLSIITINIVARECKKMKLNQKNDINEQWAKWTLNLRCAFGELLALDKNCLFCTTHGLIRFHFYPNLKSKISLINSQPHKILTCQNPH